MFYVGSKKKYLHLVAINYSNAPKRDAQISTTGYSTTRKNLYDRFIIKKRKNNNIFYD